MDGGAKGQAIDTTTGKLEHCLPLIKMWHLARKDLETKLQDMTGDELMKNGATGDYRTDLFFGHCKGEGKGQYLQLQASADTISKLPSLYSKYTTEQSITSMVQGDSTSTEYVSLAESHETVSPAKEEPTQAIAKSNAASNLTKENAPLTVAYVVF